MSVACGRVRVSHQYVGMCLPRPVSTGESNYFDVVILQRLPKRKSLVLGRLICMIWS
jgi:hypothetical protein